MIIKTITVSEWNEESFNALLQDGIKKLQSQNLVVEVQFSTVYRVQGENTEYSALLIGRRR